MFAEPVFTLLVPKSMWASSKLEISTAVIDWEDVQLLMSNSKYCQNLNPFIVFVWHIKSDFIKCKNESQVQ